MNKTEKNKMSGKKRMLIIISCCCGLILVAALGILLYINSMLGKIHYVSTSTSVSIGGALLSYSSLSSEDQLQATLEQGSSPIAYDKDVFNVLLIGSDNRSSVAGGRSDSMIILSINKKTSKIIMTSMMRDIYLPIPGYGSDRLNAAYSFGGPELLMQTIQENFRIKINEYICVDFNSFIDIIDKLGGVRIDVAKDEMANLNKYVKEINGLRKLPASDGLLLKPGKNLLLTGKQALCYARIRYVGNADFQRTERQRIVLTQVFNKLKGQNIFTLNDILNTLLPDVTTNISQGELFSLLLSSATISNYTVEQDRIPIDGSIHDLVVNNSDVLGIDFDKNIAELQSKIYGIGSDNSSSN